MRLLGVGLNGLMKFCAFMDLPRPIFQSFYDRIVNSISIATQAVSAVSKKKAALEEKRISLENGMEDGIIVSGDGSWRKRGFSSLFGITSLIGWYTKKVIDVVVKSKYCKACQHWEAKEGTAEYWEWKSTHDDECQANHSGSTGKMEVDSAVEMFQRSEELYGIKYKYYIGDGDSKTFLGISNSDPYNGFEIKQKECIDHVQKRMGTRLREIVKKQKGSSGRGKLTGKLIDELSTYYGLAIRRNSDDVEKMRKDIWATIKHKISTDSKPQHDDCPKGAESWCSWQRAVASGNISEYRHKPPLPKEVLEAITPVYENLSRDDLLQRCLGGFTQNNNESFNKSVWAIASKCQSGGKKIIDIAADISVLLFNDGLRSLMKVLETLGVTIGPNCFNFCVETDAARIEQAERSLTDAAKEARRASTSSRKVAGDRDLLLEGQLYGAGIAD
ncbi:uncharacterized protein LOC124293252 [Neodiprion lecontei]|uniref:Uncharacterized protein LOC124293252 n=1 Tax=Neodiprion lecontei TaxID=441921 RepID=A0ABM3FN06_NEOLC|nr:uncharacterized protein LOC124293252 [Neodiprion lecontei]